MQLIEMLILGNKVAEEDSEAKGATLVGVNITPDLNNCKAMSDEVNIEIKDNDNGRGDKIMVSMKVMDVVVESEEDYGVRFLRVAVNTITTLEDRWSPGRAKALWNPIQNNKYSLLRLVHPSFWVHRLDMTLNAHVEGIRAFHQEKKGRDLAMVTLIYQMPILFFINSKY